MESGTAPERADVALSYHHRVELIPVCVQQDTLRQGFRDQVCIIRNVDLFFHNSFLRTSYSLVSTTIAWSTYFLKARASSGFPTILP